MALKEEIIDDICVINDVKQECLDCGDYYKVSGLIMYCSCKYHNYHYHGHGKWHINPFSLPQNRGKPMDKWEIKF